MPVESTPAKSTHPESTPDAPSRFVVGIDLGTSNSAVAYVDTGPAVAGSAAGSTPRVQTFSVPQVIAPGQIEARERLPSFHYQPASGELSPGALKLPWSREEPAHAV